MQNETTPQEPTTPLVQINNQNLHEYTDEDGNIYFPGAVVFEGHLVCKGNLFCKGNLLCEGYLVCEGDLECKGDVRRQLSWPVGDNYDGRLGVFNSSGSYLL